MSLIHDEDIVYPFPTQTRQVWRAELHKPLSEWDEWRTLMDGQDIIEAELDGIMYRGTVIGLFETSPDNYIVVHVRLQRRITK
jgi:hypothetical protein